MIDHNPFVAAALELAKTFVAFFALFAPKRRNKAFCLLLHQKRANSSLGRAKLDEAVDYALHGHVKGKPVRYV